MELLTCELLDRAERGEVIRAEDGPPIRLAWPRPNDTRRSVVGKSPPTPPPDDVPSEKKSRDNFIVSVSLRDMEMHYNSTEKTLDVPLEWSAVAHQLGDQELLQHFQAAASRALAIFGHDAAELGNALIRIALADNTASAGALLKSVLAFSSLHRHDVHDQAIALKVEALEALAAASGRGDIGIPEAVQHVATGMLICSFETHQSTCTSGDWQWYLGSVKHVIQTGRLDKIPAADRSHDLSILLDWVYYNDVHARFSKQYWHRKPSPNSETLPVPPAAVVRPPSPLITEDSAPGMILTRLLSEAIDAISAAPPASSSPAEISSYNEFIKILDWKIRNVTIPDTASGSNPDKPLILEFYRLAMLVYLDRASKTQSGHRAKTQKQIGRAFTIIPKLGSCARQFPIFIIGCEARNDEQRAMVLDLLERTVKCVDSRKFTHTRLLLQAMWAQEDLAVGDRMDYGERLGSVISCCRIMPTFV